MPDEKKSAMRRDSKKKTWAGSKRSGPAPARHIPWPEIFKHHISVVEGHMRMLEMVQKHTVPGTGNYTTITSLVERSREMLHQSKGQSHSFIPPVHQRDQVPLGSSSESMYPGYSPAHHVYGDAALEAGHAISALRKEGKEWRPAVGGPEYAIGQGSAAGLKKRPLLKVSEDSGADVETIVEDKAEEDDGNPYFVVDTNPTPLHDTLDKHENKKLKKDKKERKEKRDKTSRLENGVGEDKEEKDDRREAPTVETDDISQEVEAKLKSKNKKESKRRRDSTEDEKVVKKVKKDKSAEQIIEVEEEEGEGAGADREKKKKKRKKTVE